MSYNSESMADMLLQIQIANVAMLDRWKLSFNDSTSKKELKKDVIFNNYFGIGK